MLTLMVLICLNTLLEIIVSFIRINFCLLLYRVYKDAFESELYLIPENYVPLYHPSSLLVKTMLHTVDDVSEWNKSPVPLHLPNECNDEDFLNIQETVKKIKIFEFTNISNLLTKLKDTLESTFPSTVNR